MQPLSNVKIVDFSTLLPGPLATLILAEAGADIVKIERPPAGDGMRDYLPKIGGESLFFGLLNRHKSSVAVDLKDPKGRESILPLLAEADVLVEQFRPGVMEKLGLGYEAVRAINPKIVYCSISGYGQSGPKSAKAGHDLNYVAESGLLSLVVDSDGTPKLPHTLIADIGGGAYPAVMNILLGLLHAGKTGEGCHIDISMNDCVLPFVLMPMGEGNALGSWPRPNGLQVTGSSPRYNIYRTSDGQFLAAAPLEEQFWKNFCDVIGLDADARDDEKDPEKTLEAVRVLIAGQTVEHWEKQFEGVDACVSRVVSLEEAAADPHLAARGIFEHRLEVGGKELKAAPVPVAPVFRDAPRLAGFPRLGEAHARTEQKSG